MAGLGRRTFAPGEVLTATNVMGYLQDQAVMKFAGTAARGSAIGTAVAEGMVSYLADTNAVEVYDGSAWLGLGPTGRIAQIVSATATTEVTTTSSSYIDTGLSVTITPTSASSKIIVLVSQAGAHGPGDGVYYLKLVRDATDIGNLMILGLINETGNYLRQSHSLNTVLTAGSTSATTLKTRFYRSAGTTYVSVNPDGVFGSIVAIEVLA